MPNEDITTIELSKTNLINNLNSIRTLLNKDAKLIVVVKANAYGHGLKEMLQMLEGEPNILYQIDDINEARRAVEYTQKELLVLGYVQPEDLPELIELKACPAILDEEHFLEFESVCKKFNLKTKAHLAVDLFFGREGVLVTDVLKITEKISASKYIELAGIYGHFSSADEDSAQGRKQSELQLNEFLSLKNSLIKSGAKDLIFHLYSSASLLTTYSDNFTHYRVGLDIYGMYPSKYTRTVSNIPALKPVLTWKTKVAQVKTLPADYPVGYNRTFRTGYQTKIALIPQGYSDGIDRKLSNAGDVLINGNKCKIIGRVSMNMFTVDCTDIANVQVGDEVVIIGSQGDQSITAENVADQLGTINYEVCTRVSPLLKRVVV